MATRRTMSLRGKERQEEVINRQKSARKEQKRKAKAHKTKNRQRTKEEKAKYFREYRQRIKEDPERHALNKKREKERWARRVATGKIQPIAKQSDRKRRLLQKKSRESSKKHYRKKVNQQVDQESDTPQEESQKKTPQQVSHQRKRARKLTINQRRATTKKLKSLEAKLEQEKRLTHRLKKRVQRMKDDRCKKADTPRSNVRKFLKNTVVSDKIRRRLVYGEVLNKQLASCSQNTKSYKEKQIYAKLLGHQLLKKYLLLGKSKHVVSMRMRKYNLDQSGGQALVYLRKKGAKADQKVQAVHNFLSEDRNSAMSPGKKEFCFKGGKMKIRYMNDTLVGLHEKFNAESPIKMSYSQFAKLRPPYIKQPTVNSRDTCVCKRCENHKLLVSGAHNAGLVFSKNAREIVSSLCCEDKKDDCIGRKCNGCRDKIILYNDFDATDTVSYSRWQTDQVQRTTKKNNASSGNNAQGGCQGKNMNITVKVTLEKPALEVVDLLEESNKEYMEHLFRINHQYLTLKSLKENLTVNDLVLHVDFSENYMCKYAAEVQSVHFGASRASVSLHTGIAYSKDFKEAFCTMSDSERHDPSSIIAHLDPVLEKYLTDLPLVTNLHTVSDGPTTQYRNKCFFDLLTRYVPQRFPQILQVTHNFSEPGHGKGGPDGVGGFLKNLADDAVAHGQDVSNFARFCSVVKAHAKTVYLKEVSKESISQIDSLLVKELKPFVGTMKVRQLTWSKERKNDIWFNTLSCFSCEAGKHCVHFGMGKWNKTVVKKAVKRSNESATSDKSKVKRLKKCSQTKSAKKVPVVKRARDSSQTTASDKCHEAKRPRRRVSSKK